MKPRLRLGILVGIIRDEVNLTSENNPGEPGSDPRSRRPLEMTSGIILIPDAWNHFIPYLPYLIHGSSRAIGLRLNIIRGVFNYPPKFRRVEFETVAGSV
jgi:hypothetical protein